MQLLTPICAVNGVDDTSATATIAQLTNASELRVPGDHLGAIWTDAFAAAVLECLDRFPR